MNKPELITAILALYDELDELKLESKLAAHSKDAQVMSIEHKMIEIEHKMIEIGKKCTIESITYPWNRNQVHSWNSNGNTEWDDFETWLNGLLRRDNFPTNISQDDLLAYLRPDLTAIYEEALAHSIMSLKLNSLAKNNPEE